MPHPCYFVYPGNSPYWGQCQQLAADWSTCQEGLFSCLFTGNWHHFWATFWPNLDRTLHAVLAWLF